VTADIPASGLPQEAVDAAAEAIADVLAQHGRSSAHAEAAVAALTAALPFLREHIRVELADEMRIPKVSVYAQNHDLRALLAAERAKVAGLRETIDKVRALAELWATHSTNATSAVLLGQHAVIQSAGRDLLALLPAVSEGAPTVGTDGQATHGRRENTCGTCAGSGWVGSRQGEHHRHCPHCSLPCIVCPPAAVVQPTGTAGECGHAEHRPCPLGTCSGEGQRENGNWEPCPSQSAKGEQ
jgi:hypothetical protein